MPTLRLKINSAVYGGRSLGRHRGKVVMIEGFAMPGETVEVRIEKEKKDYIAASVERIIEPSACRIKPPCTYFGSCGGCQLQFMTYEKQVQIKEDILRDCLKRLAKIDTALSESMVHDSPWNYRHRAQFKISRGNVGFYKGKTKKLIDIDNCPLMVQEINKNLPGARNVVRGIHSGEIHMACGDVCIALMKVPARSIQSKAEQERLGSLFPESGFSGLLIEAGGRIILRCGKPYITLHLNGLEYTISPMSFFQSNWKMNHSVARLIKNQLHPLKDKKILDLYAGAGNFSLLLASEAEVTAVEDNPYAVEDGTRNVAINNIANYRFIRSSAERFHIMDEVDSVILDPPRQGLPVRVIHNVLMMKPGRIVYISCNPATFARDLKKLCERYDIESIRLVDFFPHTFHIESLAFLRLK